MMSQRKRRLWKRRFELQLNKAPNQGKDIELIGIRREEDNKAAKSSKFDWWTSASPLSETFAFYPSTRAEKLNDPRDGTE